MIGSVARWAAIALVAIIGLAGAPATAADAPKQSAINPPKKTLWVGNSFFYFNNSMHSYVLGFAKAGGFADAAGVSVTISGSGLDWHDVKSYLRPGGIGRYSFVGNNEIVFNPPGKQFDAVLMMDCSQCPVHPQLKDAFEKTVKRDVKIVRKYGAEPVLFMSWAYKDKPEMTEQLADAYLKAGNRAKALVVPAGLAFARSVSLKPDLELYQSDKRHPSLAGTYLAAATTYAALYGKSPVGSSYLGGVDAPTAAFLQQVAWDTVQAFYGRK